MKVHQRNLKRHLFVCTNQRECGDDCKSKDAEQLVNALKAKLRDKERWDEIKVSKAGCLGGCAFGITATLYPDNILLTELTVNDVDELYKMLVKS